MLADRAGWGWLVGVGGYVGRSSSKLGPYSPGRLMDEAGNSSCGEKSPSRYYTTANISTLDPGAPAHLYTIRLRDCQGGFFISITSAKISNQDSGPHAIRHNGRHSFSRPPAQLLLAGQGAAYSPEPDVSSPPVSL